jgi:NO-binding membrane sensor protein with MHYT domain
MVQLRVVYDPKIVALAAAIGFAGAFGAVSTCEQFRLATVNKRTTKYSYHWVLLVGGSFGGVCVWGAHFVGMSSFRLLHGDVEIPLRYDVGNALMLLAISLFLTTAAVAVAIADDCFNRSTKEIMEKFIARASYTYTITQLKQMSQIRILSIVFSHSIEKPVIGGLISGGAVGLMHYVGMIGMRFQGTIEYDPGVVFASCITSVCVIIGGFWLFFRVLSLFPSLDILRVLSAGNGMFGISGLHYIGLQAATFHYDPDVSLPDPSNTIDSQQMLVGVLIACAIYTILVLVYVISDLRVWLLRTSMQLHHADRALATMQKLSAGRPGTYSLIASEAGRYAKKHSDNTAVLLVEVDVEVTALQQCSAPRALYNDAPESDETGSDLTSSGNNDTTQPPGTLSSGGALLSPENDTTPTSASPNAHFFARSHSLRQVHPQSEGADGEAPGQRQVQGDIESQLPVRGGTRSKPSSECLVDVYSEVNLAYPVLVGSGAGADTVAVTGRNSPRGPASLTSGNLPNSDVPSRSESAGLRTPE